MQLVGEQIYIQCQSKLILVVVSIQVFILDCWTLIKADEEPFK